MYHMQSKGGWTGTEPGAKLSGSQSTDTLEVFPMFKKQVWTLEVPCRNIVSRSLVFILVYSEAAQTTVGNTFDFNPLCTASR